MVHPDQGNITQASVQVVTGVSTYTTLPFNLVLNLTVWNSTFGGADTTLWLNITDFVTSATCSTNNLTSMVVPITPVVTNLTSGASVSTQFLTFPLTTAFFTNATTNCPNFLVDPEYMMITMVQNGGPVNGTATAVGVQLSIFGTWTNAPVTSFVLTTPTSSLNFAPTPGQTGTYTLSATYTGQYVGKVQLVVKTPSGGVGLSANLRWNGTTPTVVTWSESTPGTYPYSLIVYTAYGNYSTLGQLSLSPSSLVFDNTTTWTNSTLIPGLGSGAAGTLLLVVGLIVGILVALVVGRLVWGGPAAPAAPQPWSGQQQGAGTNVCSVCGQSFPTPEALAAHQKSEHGMQ